MRRLFLCLLVFSVLGLALAQMPKSYKRGVSENSFNHVEEIDALAPGVTWTYNWGPNPSKNVAHKLRPGGDMEFVPMIWNGNFNESAIRDSLEKYPGTKYLLGFNEPNFKSQANMTPSQAAELWPVLEGIAADYNLKLVSPALNFPDDTINDARTIAGSAEEKTRRRKEQQWTSPSVTNPPCVRRTSADAGRSHPAT